VIRYNTLIVLLGVGLLGAAAGPIGAFAVLRRRALVGDALAHAALPGLCVAFLLAGEKNLLWMLLGALASGLLGVAVLALMGRYSRIKEDAAVGVVLSVFFGAGIVLSNIIQRSVTGGSKAGLDSFILGKTAGLLLSDVLLLAVLAPVCLIVVALLYKELKLVSFDREFADVQGMPTSRLEALLLGLLAVVVVAGLQTVGAVMVAALLIVPGASARFWTDRLGLMLVLSGAFGLMTGLIGATLSANLDKTPAGPVIVLVGAAIFTVSALVAPRRGLIAQALDAWAVARRADRERTLARLHEGKPVSSVSLERAAAEGDVRLLAGGGHELTEQGKAAAEEAARRQREWRELLEEQPEMASLARPLDGLAVKEVLPPLVREGWP
jgi:manganese/zinc/iron transport system permease protein